MMMDEPLYHSCHEFNNASSWPSDYNQPFEDQLLQRHAITFVVPEIAKFIIARPFYKHSLSLAEQARLGAEIHAFVHNFYRSHFNPDARVDTAFKLLNPNRQDEEESFRRSGWLVIGVLPGREGTDKLMVRFSVAR